MTERLMVAGTESRDRKASALCYAMRVEEQLYVKYIHKK
jgi:hypothetical protein